MSGKKKKPPKENAQVEVLNKLGLENFRTTPLDTASMLNISTWTLENQDCLGLEDLPNAFLRRLWLLNPDARSPCCKLPHDVQNNATELPEQTISGFGGETQCAINPLDLVAAVFMSADTFLQQEMTVRMVQCQFAVPLILPNIDPKKPSQFLLWPLRGVISQWRSHFPDKNRKVQEGDLASTHMPVVSCVKLGHCSVSKSQVLNHILSGLKSHNETFLHRGMDGGQLPRRVANGLVEIGWYLPTGDTARDIFPVPMVISNLRGNASTHEKCLRLLCQASSAVVVFSGNLREKEKQLLASCKNKANKIILIDLSDTEENENRSAGFVDQNLKEAIGLPEGSVLQGKDLSEEELAKRLCDTLKDLLPDKLTLVSLEAAAKLAARIGLNVDEGSVCKKVMATVDAMLQGLDEGSAQFREKQLPLQGPLWSKLAKIEKEESKQKKEEEEINPQLQKEKKDIMDKLSRYKMTPVMKTFINVLFTKDKVKRTFFLTWMKLRLRLKQLKKQNNPQDLRANMQVENKDDLLEHSVEHQNGLNDNIEGSDNSRTDLPFEVLPVIDELQVFGQHSDNGQLLDHILATSTNQDIEPQSKHREHFQSTPDPVRERQLDITSNEKKFQGAENKVCFEEPPCSQLFEPDSFELGLEHFLREMGLIFELKHISPGSGSHNVQHLPSLAADLILHGIPLELMDGDASNIPIHWLSSVFAELKQRLPQGQCRTRVLTNIGLHHARNAKVLSALFGVKFPEGKNRSTKGMYLIVLCLPDNYKRDMDCDFLLLIDVEGLGLLSQDNTRNTQVHDTEMATVATGLSDVLIQNISPHAGSKFDTDFVVMVSALLCIKQCGSMPTCQLLIHDGGIKSLLQASQIRHVSEILQSEAGGRGINNADNHYAKTTGFITSVKQPWSNMSLCKLGDEQYSKAVLKLKKNLFAAMKKCAAKSKASSLPEFLSHLCAVWDAVKSKSFPLGLENTDMCLAFSLLCTEIYQWEDSFMEHMDNWLMGASHTIFATKARSLDSAIQNELLNKLKNDGREEIKTEVDKLRSEVEVYLMQDNLLKMNAEIFKPILMSKIDDLQEQTTEETMQKLETVSENHCCSTQMQKFETLLEKEQESKLHELLWNSKSTNVLLQDAELEKEFEGVWGRTLSNFDFRPSERDDITTRVTDLLKENLISRGLQKHMEKLEVIGQHQKTNFQVYAKHFGYRSRLKHMFEDNNRLQRLEAQRIASNIIEEYHQFAADKCSLPADFSDSYITELLENVENALKKKPLEIRSAFEVDLKVYLCNAACQDFQKLHDRYAKDRELLRCITAAKSTYLSEFIYQFRKRDQCQRVAQAFTSKVIKPTVLDYIYKPLGLHIAEEIQAKEPRYQSSRAFHQSLLEELVKEDHFESFLEYLSSYDIFRLRKIQETVVAHLSKSTSLDKWRQQRLGEIVGKIAAAVSQVTESTRGTLSDTKPLLERVCFILERDADVDVTRASLDGPLFSITTEWDRFVTYLMELLAEMRLDLAQDFSQNVDVTQLLQCLPFQPQHFLFNRVRGCDKQCPLCNAPCEVDEMGHDVHRALLHRPKSMLPYDSCSLSCIILPESMTQENPSQNKNASVTCSERLHSLYLNWNISPNSQILGVYWRYVLVRFNMKFAQEYDRKPAKIPEEWKKITAKDALDSLKEAFPTQKY